MGARHGEAPHRVTGPGGKHPRCAQGGALFRGGDIMKPRYQFALLVVLIVVLNVGAGILSMNNKAATGWLLLPWLLTAILMVLCFAVIGRLPPVVDSRGVLIDQR